MMNDLRSARNVTSYTLFIFIEELFGRKVSAQHTVHPKNYAHGSWLIICYGVVMIYSIDILRFILLITGQYYDGPRGSETTLENVAKYLNPHKSINV